MTEKILVEFCRFALKGHVSKESEVVSPGRREAEVGMIEALLLLIKY